MFDTRFNNGYQNTVVPLNTEQYTQTGVLPNMMNNNIPYPAMPSQSVPAANVPGQNSVAYAGGGKVKKKKASKEKSPYPMLAEMIRKQGNGEDTILAHINPLEAMLLKDIGGSGTINKKTGLPQFGFFDSPKKWIKSVIGPTVGMVLGNMLLPGIGGMVGGALGGATGSAVRGRHDLGKSAIRGLTMGAAAPTIASLAGSGLSSLGATGAGSTLSSYGTKNAILPALGFGAAGNAGSAASNAGSAVGKAASTTSKAASAASKAAAEAKLTFTEKLLGKSKDFLTDPENILTLGAVAAAAANRPKEKKEKTPEQQADEHKRLKKALRLSPAEKKDLEADLIAKQQMKRRIARQKFLPEDRFGDIEPVYRRSNTPEQRKQQGQWLNYYNNPQFTGAPVPYKKGGEASRGIMHEAEEMQYPEESTPKKKYRGLLGGLNDMLSSIKEEQEGSVPKYRGLLGGLNDMLSSIKEEQEGSVPKKRGLLGGLNDIDMSSIKEEQEGSVPEKRYRGLLDELNDIDMSSIKEEQEGSVPKKRYRGLLDELNDMSFKKKGRIARQKFLPEDRFSNIEPMYNPQFTGKPVPHKKGGEASRGIMYEAEEMQYPEGLGQYLQGDTGGQDDKIKALLSDGEYVIPADAVAHLGDGNNAAGAKKLDRALKNIRKQRGGSIHKLPPKATSLASYLI